MRREPRCAGNSRRKRTLLPSPFHPENSDFTPPFAGKPAPTAGRRSAGFTLLEMLVALAIVAIAVGSATLALRPDEQRRVNDEAERLALLLEQAREEGELGGVPLAWVASASGYEFQRREFTEVGSAWSAVRGDDLLHPRAWPTGLRVLRQEAAGRVFAAGERIRLEAEVPLLLELALGTARARVSGDFAGYRAEAVK